MENGPFIDGLPINFMVIFPWLIMLVITRWYLQNGPLLMRNMLFSTMRFEAVLGLCNGQ